MSRTAPRSRARLSAVLDVEDPLPGACTLEVSSAGHRPPADPAEGLDRFAGHLARAELGRRADRRPQALLRHAGGAGNGPIRLRLDDGRRPHLPLRSDIRRQARADRRADRRPPPRQGADRTDENERNCHGRPPIFRAWSCCRSPTPSRARRASSARKCCEAMEQAIQKAGRAKYGHEKDIRATIDRKTGEIRLSRWTEVVETVENEETQIPLARSQRASSPRSKLGDFIIDPLPPIDFGRIAAQTAKQVIVQRVREAERQAPVRGVQGPRRRDRQRRGQAHRVRQPHGRSRPRRGAAAPRRADPARELPQRRPGARLHLRRARGAARAADLPVAHPSATSWPSCSPRRCRRSTTASSRSRRWPAIPGSRAKMAVISPRQPRSIRSAPASACAASRVQAVVQRAAGREDRHHPLVAEDRDLRGERAGAGRGHQGGDGRGGRPRRGGGAGRAAARSPSAGAARTCGWPASSPAGTSTS